MGEPEVEESKIPASAAKISPFQVKEQPKPEQPKAVNNPERKPEFKSDESPEALKRQNRMTKEKDSQSKEVKKNEDFTSNESSKVITAENKDKAQDIMKAVSLNDTLLSDPVAPSQSMA